MPEIKIPWPDWNVKRNIGNGSFGRVFEIERTDQFGNTEKAALKVISIPKEESEFDAYFDSGYDQKTITAEYEHRLERILNEYALMAKLKGHSNIISVEDRKAVKQDNGIGWDVYIRMELLTALPKAIRYKEIDEEEIKKIGIAICKALISCHEKNIIHRDIKPANIFVSDYGEYKLGDFGVARVMTHTTNATMTGTLEYMAPEVYWNERYSSEADIYSLGLVLYWLLNNKKMPFEPLDRLSTMDEKTAAYRKRLEGKEDIPKPLNGSESLKQIVLKAISYKPADRYHTAGEMLDALEETDDAKAFALPDEPLQKENSSESSSEEISDIYISEDPRTVGKSWLKDDVNDEQQKSRQEELIEQKEIQTGSRTGDISPKDLQWSHGTPEPAEEAVSQQHSMQTTIVDHNKTAEMDVEPIRESQAAEIAHKEDEREKKRGVNIGFAAGAMLLIAAGILLMNLLIGKDKTNKPEPTTTPTASTEPRPTPESSSASEGESIIGQAYTNVTDLTIRDGAGINYAYIDLAAAKTTYDVYETVEADGYTWYRISENGWIPSDGTWITYTPKQ